MKKRLGRKGRVPVMDRTSLMLMLPYMLIFFLFIALPVLVAMFLSFTYFDGVQAPTFAGLKNYLSIFTQDRILMERVIPNTLTLAIVIGPVSLALQFLIAWMLAHITKTWRIIFSLIFYSPSMTGSVAMSTVWKVLFSGDRQGQINALLLRLKLIETPIQFLQSEQYILPLMIVVTLWSSMGIGFLSIMVSMVNNDQEIYEAAYVDGIRNSFQEMIYITIPSMKPAMLFATVMAIVNTFSVGEVGVSLTGSNPTPLYAGHTFVTHISDFGFNQYNMGYAAALSVVLILIIFGVSKIANRLFLEKEG